jgi:hypothetical protein
LALDHDQSAALDRQGDLRGAVVAGDDLEPGAYQRIVELRGGLGIDSGDAADDELLVEQVLRGLVRSRVPGRGHRGLAVEAAEPMEFLDLEASAGGIDQLGQQHSALDQCDRGAVLRSRAEHVVGRRDARRHVLHDQRRLARDVLAEMARRQPRLQVVAAAHAGAHDEGDLLAGIEVVRRGRGRSMHDQRRGDGRQLEERCGGKTSPRATTHRKSPEWDVC